MNKSKIRIVLLLLILLIGISQIFALRGERYATEAMEYFQRGEYRNAIEQYKQANRAADETEELYFFWLGKLYVAVNDTTNARIWFDKYIASGETEHKADVETYLSILNRQQKIFTALSVSDMPKYIYSWNSDYGAVMSPNNQYVYFTSLSPASYEKENIWRAERFASGWGRPELLPNLNTDKNEAIGSFSTDGKTAYLFGNFERGKIDGDIYTSYLVNNRWTDPINLSIVNSDQVEIQPMVFEDKWMFFSSSRDGGQGNMDIWVSELVNGSWTIPQNLGPMINSSGNEQSPFMDFDGKTLFFASDTHPGLGGYDIFKAVKIGDSWQSWSIPENLGIPANSIRDDRSFFHQKDSNQGFISTDRKAKGFEKFIQVSFTYAVPQSYLIRDPETGRIISVDIDAPSITDFIPTEPELPDFVLTSGKITDEAGNPIETTIVFETMIDGIKHRYTADSDSNGNYRLDIPFAPKYDVVVNEEGYMIFTQVFEPKPEDNTLNIVLQKLREERVFVLDNVQFEFNSSILTQASLEILNNAVITLLNNPDIRVEISGHTCNLGSAKYNQWLSERRANSVTSYLISKGIDSSRLKAVGYGLARPMVSNDTVAGKIKNRRVEFRVMSDNE